MTMKATFTLLFLSIVMTACVYNEELADVTDLYTAKQESTLPYSMPTTVKSAETSGSRSIPSNAFAQVKIHIRNQMPGLHLTVESIRLGNIHLSGTYHLATEYQMPHWETDTTRSTLTIETEHLELAPNEETVFPQEGSIPFIPQTHRVWNPSVLPQESEGCYLLLNCKIYNIQDTTKGYQKGSSTQAAIPLSVRFQSNQESVIVLTMAPDCPWYNIDNATPQPLFVPITFDVSVEDWQIPRSDVCHSGGFLISFNQGLSEKSDIT